MLRFSLLFRRDSLRLTDRIGTHKCLGHVLYRPNLNSRVAAHAINKICIYLTLDDSWYVRPAYNVRHIMIIDDAPSAATMPTCMWHHYSMNILRSMHIALKPSNKWFSTEVRVGNQLVSVINVVIFSSDNSLWSVAVWYLQICFTTQLISYCKLQYIQEANSSVF